jgi:hypothetical protein
MNGTLTPLDPDPQFGMVTPQVEERGSDPELCDYGIYTWVSVFGE